jgi:hypothetical protein
MVPLWGVLWAVKLDNFDSPKPETEKNSQVYHKRPEVAYKMKNNRKYQVNYKT